MKIGILDLGTNTFHLLIAEVSRDGSWEKIFKSKQVVKLGEGGIHRDRIGELPFKRGIIALQHYKDILKEHRIREVFAFATSAVRGAINGTEFVKAAFEATGIQIQVISGSEEARLIYLGVRQCVNIGREPVLIMDIGGGSTEFIIADDRKIFWKKSFDIGAARLLEIFKPSDPVRKKEIAAIEAFLQNELKPLQEALQSYAVHKLIGSSGSFDTFAEMIGHQFYGRNVIKGRKTYSFQLDEFFALHKKILASTTEERLHMKGLIRLRVDMIVLASICTAFTIRFFEIREMAMSKFALKEGALADRILKRAGS